MASNETLKAIVIATGEEIDVYRHKEKKDTWVDYSNCKDTYTTQELKFK